jgi:hypothetical protein
MKLKPLGLAAAGLLAITVTTAYAAGLWPDFPVVGGATYCAGTSNSATGSIIGLVTGCPNQVPAGPSIVTGNEQIPADTRLGSAGAAPQTVLIPMASLNALPIQVYYSAPGVTPAISATNTSGGVFFYAATTITKANVTLPQGPIDGQQYALNANQPINQLNISGGAVSLANNAAPVSLTNSTTAATISGFRWLYNASAAAWFRLQ